MQSPNPRETTQKQKKKKTWVLMASDDEELVWVLRELEGCVTEVFVSSQLLRDERVRRLLCLRSRTRVGLSYWRPRSEQTTENDSEETTENDNDVERASIRAFFEDVGEVLESLSTRELWLCANIASDDAVFDSSTLWTEKAEKGFVALLQKNVLELLEFQCPFIPDSIRRALEVPTLSLKRLDINAANPPSRIAHIAEVVLTSYDYEAGCIPCNESAINDVTHLNVGNFNKCLQHLDPKKARIKEIDLADCSMKQLAHFLTHYRHLQGLHMMHWEDAEFVFDALCGSALTRLQLFRCSEDDDSCTQSLCKLLSSTRITSFSGDWYSREVCNALCVLSSVTDVSIESCSLASDDLIGLFRSLPLRSCTFLGVSLADWDTLVDEQWPLVLDALPPTLEKFKIYVTVAFADEMRTEVLKPLRLPRLAHLDWNVKDCNYTVQDLTLIREHIFSATQLTYFSLAVGNPDEEQKSVLYEIMENAPATIGWFFRGLELPILTNSRNAVSISRARLTTIVLIAIRRFRSSGLNSLPKDVVTLLAKSLWETRREGKEWWKQ